MAASSPHRQPNKAWVERNPAVVKNFLAAFMQSMRFLRSYTKNRAALTAIADKYTGITYAVAIRNSLPEVARLSSPEVNCPRLAAQAKLLVSIGTIDVLPPCGDIAFLKLVPKKLKGKVG